MAVFFLFFPWACFCSCHGLRGNSGLVAVKCYILSPSYSETMQCSGYILEGGRSGAGESEVASFRVVGLKQFFWTELNGIFA